MKLGFKYIIFCCCIPLGLFGQPQVDYVTAFRALELRLQKGDQQALKEVGDFLDDQRSYPRRQGQPITLHIKAFELLKDYLLLQTQEFELTSTTTRKAFLQFYYQHEKTWQFSEFLQVFYLNPIDALPYQYRLIRAQTYSKANKQAIFRHYRREFLQAIELKLYDQVPEILERIAQLRVPQGFLLLRRCLQGKYWKISATNTFALRLYEAACYAMRHYQNLGAAQMILKTIKEEKTYLQGAIEALSYITNIHLEALKIPFDKSVSAYQRFIREHRTIEGLRKAGYRQLFDYEPFHFKNKADYYGKILNKSYAYFWIRYNALQDLKRLQNPKILWYLAAQVFQQKGKVRYNWQIDTQPLSLMRDLTGIEVLIPNEEGEWTTQLEDKTARINFVRYWQTHYQNYRWDESTKKFINTKEQVKENPQSERFRRNFKKLHNRDQRIAMVALQNLANEQPLDALQALPEKKLIIFPQSYQLPLYPYLSLEVLIRLRNYCESNDLAYAAYLKEMEEKGQKLATSMTTKKRIELEEVLYQHLTLKNVTALEHWAIISENKSWRLGYSLGRVLQRFYANSRDSLFQNANHLKLFVRKIGWFAKLRPKGLSKLYKSFLGSLDKEEQQRLTEILTQKQNKKEGHKDELQKGGILKEQRQLELIIAQINQQPILKLHTALNRFVKNPHAKHWQKLNGVKVYHPDDFREVVQQIKQFSNPEKIQWLLSWLKFQKSLASVPFLMQIIDDQRVIGKHRGYRQYIPLTVSDEVVFILEQIYKHSFIDAKDFYRAKPRNVYRFSKNTLPWKRMWAKHKEHYRDWEADFFTLKIKSLTKQPQLKINTLNNILLSPFFQTKEHHLKVLQALAKVQPRSDLAYLQWSLSVEPKDLKYFAQGVQYPALLKRLIPLVNAPTDSILIFVDKASQNLSEIAQGKLYFELGQTTELWQWLKQERFDTLRRGVIRQLQRFKANLSQDFTEREVDAVIFVLKYHPLPFEEKLVKVKQIKDQALKSEVLSQLVFMTRYSEVPTLLKNTERLKSLAPNYDVIHTRIRHHLLYNLGLPLENNFEQDLQVKRDLKTLSESDFFDRYIIKWFPGLVLAIQNREIEHLLSVLKKAIGVPLVGVGQEDRRLYALLRFFEINFRTSLGFPPNMYNAQNWSEQISVKIWQQKWEHFVRWIQNKTKTNEEKY
ncbi:hypothetical protein BKI52_35425 [marine bacterium AO1-C]|nr:hypothetical protein BKI52_35425 [marine bacterium AO1-C]